MTTASILSFHVKFNMMQNEGVFPKDLEVCWNTEFNFLFIDKMSCEVFSQEFIDMKTKLKSLFRTFSPQGLVMLTPNKTFKAEEGVSLV